MSIKEYYTNKYPSDELGKEIDNRANFVGLLDHLNKHQNIYAYMGVADSLVRERVFEGLADQLGKPYNYVYNIWLNINE